jgi:putative ABC transport system permease protein
MVIIINEAMAKQFFGDEDPLGRHLHLFGRPPGRQIIGIAKTIKYNGIGERETAHMYVPLEQNYASQVVVQVRAVAGNADAMLGTVRRELQQLEPTMPLLAVNTYDTILETSLWAPRLGASLLTAFGTLAMLLAAVGLYGVMAYNVSQRTREIGVRMAIGASTHDVRNMVVRQGLLLAASGVVIGALIALALARLVTNLLYEVSGADPATFLTIPALLLAVAAVATLVPAWKASRVDPVLALRA